MIFCFISSFMICRYFITCIHHSISHDWIPIFKWFIKYSLNVVICISYCFIIIKYSIYVCWVDGFLNISCLISCEFNAWSECSIVSNIYLRNIFCFFLNKHIDIYWNINLIKDTEVRHLRCFTFWYISIIKSSHSHIFLDLVYLSLEFFSRFLCINSFDSIKQIFLWWILSYKELFCVWVFKNIEILNNLECIVHFPFHSCHIYWWLVPLKICIFITKSNHWVVSIFDRRANLL